MQLSIHYQDYGIFISVHYGNIYIPVRIFCLAAESGLLFLMFSS